MTTYPASKIITKSPENDSSAGGAPPGVASDTSTLFMSAITDSSAVSAPSFSSLEELLDVTGISSGGASGVDSLQQLAREVEDKHSKDSLEPPAAKRVKLSPPVPPHTPTPPHPLPSPTTPPPTVVGGARSVVVQLVQLYKHYQQQGDVAGMARVKQQLNSLVASQRKLLSSPSIVTAGGASESTTSSLPPATEPSAEAKLRAVNVVSQKLRELKSLMSALPEGDRPKTVNELVRRYGNQLLTPSSMTTKEPTNPPSTLAPLTPLTPLTSLPSSQLNSTIKPTASTISALQQLATLTIPPLPAFNMATSTAAQNCSQTSLNETQNQTLNLTSTQSTSIPGVRASNQSPAMQTTNQALNLLSGILGSSLSAAQTLNHSSVQSTGLVPSPAVQKPFLVSSYQQARPLTVTPSPAPRPSITVLPPPPPLPTTLTPSHSSVQPPVIVPIATTATPPPRRTEGIQVGVATPLPPGLTLETLNVLCRMPESELVKLKLPAGLLSAIRVWKERQQLPTKVQSTHGGVQQQQQQPNIPVLIPQQGRDSRLPDYKQATRQQQQQHHSMVTSALLPSRTPPPAAAAAEGVLKVGDALSLKPYQLPRMMPPSGGFPPRSLHAFVPAPPPSSNPLQAQVASSGDHHGDNNHMTRYRVRLDKQQADSDRLQALTKALQTSEEARIAFRFSAHLEKMHSQLQAPDCLSAFGSRQDTLARLLPYHLCAEPEPPPTAIEKADAVFESVAQVLVSRSRGLVSRFNQLLCKSEPRAASEGGLQLHLDRLFVEGERARELQERAERQTAEQIANDLSVIGGDGLLELEEHSGIT